jgi:autotransporter passenger strand-loop-strand repeat protein
MAITISSGTYNVSSGQVDTGDTILFGATMDVLSGGIAKETNAEFGFVDVLDGGTAIDTTVNSGFDQAVFTGGSATGTTVTGIGSREFVFAGGMDTGTTVNSGSYELVGYPGSAGGTAIGTNVQAGGSLDVFVGGKTISASLVGSANVGRGAAEIVSSGGVASGTILSASGELGVSAGGRAVGTTVDLKTGSFNGGFSIFNGGLATGTIVNIGGFEFVDFGGTDVGALINAGGTVFVSAGASINNATIAPGGVMFVLRGGVANNTNIFASGSTAGEVVSGQTYYETIYAGGAESVRQGGESFDLTVSSGGSQNLGLSISAGGESFATTVESGGLLRAFLAGVALDSVISSGGLLVVSSGGTASDTQLYASGAFAGESIRSGGAAYNETIYSGGAESVQSGGIAYSDTVSNGGVLDLGLSPEIAQELGIAAPPGGVASNTAVDSGGRFVVRSAGIATDTTLNSGASGVVSSGGTTSDTVINGGTLEIAVGGSATGAITFGAAGGTLGIDSTTMPSAVISGFTPAGTIDFAGLGFDNAGTATLAAGNILQIAENGSTYDVTFDPSQTFQGETFSLAEDNNGGTELIERTPININNTINLIDGNVALEALQLADDVYNDHSQSGPQYSTFSANQLDPLAARNNLVPPETNPAPDNWHPVTAAELGMNPEDSSLLDTLRYSFVNGLYQAFDTSDTINGIPSEADAMVLTGVVDNKKTLVIVFRGTDQISDFADFADFASHYAKFSPLIGAIQSFLADNSDGVQQVLVAGHSLGAAMVDYFMNSVITNLPNASQYTVQAYTDGSPGVENSVSSSKIVNFIHTNDIVPILGTLSNSAAAYLEPIAAAIASLVASVPGYQSYADAISSALDSMQRKSNEGSDALIDSDVVSIGNTSLMSLVQQGNLLTFATSLASLIEENGSGALFAEHDASLYAQDVQKIVDFSRDYLSPFSGTALAMSLVQNTVYQQPANATPIQIAVGAPGTNMVHIYSSDNYVLGYDPDKIASTNQNYNGSAAGAEQIVWDLPSATDALHIVDGGAGMNAEVVLSGDRSDYLWVNLAGGQTDLYYVGPSSIFQTDGEIGQLYRVGTFEFSDNPSVLVPVGQPGVNYVQGTAGQPLVRGSGSWVLDGSALENQLISTGNGANTLIGGSGDTLSAGNGVDTAIGGSDDTINLGNGNDTIFGGSNNSITAGNGNDLVVSGDPSTISLGNGSDIVVGKNGDKIIAGNGNDSITGGANSTVILGNGKDNVSSGPNSTIKVGNGNDTISAGADNVIGLGKGADAVAFGAILGMEQVIGFIPTHDTIQFNHALFANYAAVMASSKQVGQDTIITYDGSDTVTLVAVNMTSLHPSNFQFN